MSLTLIWTDSQDGTGGLATLAGSDAATITLYAQPVIGPAVWVVVGTRSGDGTLTVALTPGAWWLYASAGGSVSTVVAALASATPLAPHSQILYAAQAQIQSLALVGIEPGNVRIAWDDGTMPEMLSAFPEVALTIAGQAEDEEPYSTEQAGVVYPVRVTVRARLSPLSGATIDSVLYWRWQIMRALRQMNGFGSVPGSWRTEVHADPVAKFDPQKAIHYEGALTLYVSVVETPN